MLKFYNTKTRRIDEFNAINEGKVMLYTCGPTVYNYLHVGNWVAYIRWDTLVRTLVASGYDVDRVMNITDVGHLVSDADDGEDKMEKGAKREGKTAWEVAKMYTDDFLDGMHKLNLIAPTHITKATDYITEQLELVRTLHKKGFTYQIDDGIYFDTSKFPAYADFAHLNLDELKEGARVEFNQQKRNASDFALWKFSPAGETRDMEWDTPVDLLDEDETRKGFPGWHLECSAMAMDKLAETIDIHTGGIDHIPVHHTNEIAQSEAATGKTFANYWLHNNFLLVDGTKVSKSLGNTYELKDLEAKGFNPEDFRVFVLQSHYQSESNFTWENLQGAKNRLQGYKSMAQMRFQQQLGEDVVDFENAYQAILQAFQDDLNTPVALQILSDVNGRVEENGIAPGDSESFETFLLNIDSLFGTSLSHQQDISESEKKIIVSRQMARDAKDWATSDTLRDELAKLYITVRDTPHGSIWSRL
jgi:cysteinyl-tRNA synthetase